MSRETDPRERADGPEGRKRHGPPKGHMGRFMEPRLLLLLAQKTQSYGYELMDDLARFGFDAGTTDPGAIYRALRGMEKAGLVTSEWDTAGAGPAKRRYRLTAEGEERLYGWAAHIRHRKAALEQFLDRYEAFRATKQEPSNAGKEG